MSFASLTRIRRNQFWVFQFVGWAGVVVILLLLSLLCNPPTTGYLIPLASVYVSSAVVAVILTSVLRLLYRLAWNRGFILRFLLLGLALYSRPYFGS